jgi:nitrogen regulatory protein P-II 2
MEVVSSEEDQAMKRIEAIIQPQFVDRVREALVTIGVQGMTTMQAQRYGKQTGHTVYRGAEYVLDCVQCVKLEIALDEDLLEEAIGAIMIAANAEGFCVGKIFISDLVNVIRIHTGEYNYHAV